MSTLIVYYTLTGNNGIIASELQERLGCDLARIETVRRSTKFSIFLDFVFKRSPAIRELGVSLLKYERVVFMGPIWAGKIATPLRTFMRTKKDTIQRYAFLSVCGGGQSSQKERIKDELTQLLNRPPECIAECWINNVVPAVKRNTLAVSEFRQTKEDADVFQEELDEFVKELNIQSPALSMV